MSEHVETLRELLDDYRPRNRDAEAISAREGTHHAKVDEALTAAIEALEGREWQCDGPDSPGSWARLYTGSVKGGDIVFVRQRRLADWQKIHAREAEAGFRPLWLRLPEPPPVPESEGE